MAHLKMSSVATTRFIKNIHTDDQPFSLIEQKSLFSRLVQEAEGALGELTSDPRGFIRSLFSADTKDAKRRQRIYLGLTTAVVVHVALLILIAIMGWHTVFVKAVPPPVPPQVVWVPPNSPESGSLPIPHGSKDQGGGRGGGANPLPATKGPTPQMSTNPQIVKPNAPQLVLPSIQMPSTIVGPDSAAPPKGLALGVPSGVAAEAPSPGPGTGDGLGGRNGSGAGLGDGPGGGNGSRGGSGDKGKLGTPFGSDDPKGPIPYNLISRFPDRTPIVWLHRPTPIITPEAQANKVNGEVLLRATFSEDGKISDIEVVREVPFMVQSAIEALQRSRFRPATIKGRPVTLTNVPVIIKCHY